MSDTSVNITKLPEATEITTSDYLLLENASGTQILKFNNFVVTEYNTTFRHLLSGHTTDIANNTTNITSLSTTKAWKETASTSVVSTMSSVGIGTAAPGGNLHVYGSGGQEVYIGSSNAGGATIVLDGYANGDAVGGDYSYIKHQDDGKLEIRNIVGNTYFTNDTGNVGIGTASPGEKLDVAGNIGLTTSISFNTTTKPRIGQNADDLYLQPGTDRGIYLVDHDGAALMTVKDGGNVGIGTTAPETKLHLNPSSGSHAAITLGESSTTPDTPSVGDECRIYMKGDKLIVQFNDGGIIRYKYMDLTGSTDPEIWTNTTTAP